MFQKVVSPPPPMSGVRAATSSMLNLPSEIETASPNFCVTISDRSVVVPPSVGKARAVLTGRIEPSPCWLALWPKSCSRWADTLSPGQSPSLLPSSPEQHVRLAAERNAILAVAAGEPLAEAGHASAETNPVERRETVAG